MDSWILAKDKVRKRTVFDFRNALDAGIILLAVNSMSIFQLAWALLRVTALILHEAAKWFLNYIYDGIRGMIDAICF